MKKIVCWIICLCSIIWLSANAVAYTGPGGLAAIKLYGGEFIGEIDATEGYVDYLCIGEVEVWNTKEKFHLRVFPFQGVNTEGQTEVWKIKTVKAYVGSSAVPIDASGAPLVEQFPYQVDYGAPQDTYHLVLDLYDDLGFRWGIPYEEMRQQNVCVQTVLVKVDPETGNQLAIKDAWTLDPAFEIDVADDEWEYDLIEIGSGRLKQSHRIKKDQGVTNHVRIMRGVLDQALLSHWGSTVYELAHPRRAHFIDSPVTGLTVVTPTYEGKTDESGAFDYFPEERADFFLGNEYLGNALADHKMSPVDLFEGRDMDDNQVINMARLLQSLDADGDPSSGISITDSVVTAFETAMDTLDLYGIDFNDDDQVAAIIDQTIAGSSDSPDLALRNVDKKEAKAHLDKHINSTMFRKNLARTPDLASAKAKLNIMPVWFPAMRANGEPADFLGDEETLTEGIPYYDDEGNLIRTATEAKPLVAVYTDEIEGYGAADVFAAVSRDDGNTWKRKNISRMADRSSFTLGTGETFYGHCKKPVFQVKGNKIIIAWTSKFAKGGKPCYAIKKCPDTDGDGVNDSCTICTGSGDNETCETDYPHDDAYYTEDIWGVSGPQRSVDYTDQGYPEVGEVPYSAVWVARGIIATETDVSNGIGQYKGDIVWFKPERLTSGRRDANQVFMGGADGAGFAIAWQEDPKGLRPGEAKGPGPGWGGATTNHKTDIWYSYITWADFAKVDENFVPGGDPEHDIDDVPTRPKALVPMSLPIRISDNDAVNTKNASLVDSEGNVITPASGSVEDIAYSSENLTRCVKFEGGKGIFSPIDTETDFYNLTNPVPETHQSTMNCTNCHVPYGEEPVNDAPTQGAPIPLVVSTEGDPSTYLGGFTNADCVSCHYNNVVPRDRVIAAADCADCQAKGGIWKDGTQDGSTDVITAYYPYEGYPYVAASEDDTNDGSHRYITEYPGLWSYSNEISPDGIGLYEKINQQGVTMEVAVTTDGRLLDGNTGAARPNLFLQTYTKPDGTKSAWAIMAYEESKGVGLGPDENTGTGEKPEDGSGYDPYETFPDAGKNAIYHSFDFTKPDVVSAGTILNLPETDENGEPLTIVEPDCLGSVVDENGDYVCVPNPTAGETLLDWKGDTILAYENARRPRFILQSKSSAFGGVKSDGSFKAPDNSGTVLIVLYKQGEEGAGRPSDIMARRFVVKNTDGSIKTGNPWAPGNLVPGVQNLSTVNPTLTWINPDRDENAKGEGVKVCKWDQPEECLHYKSGVNPYEDARAHRGAIRGDFVVLGYSYTPNWAASRNAHDKYDFYIRRSFDGGATWTTDPDSDTPVIHTDYFINPEGISGSELDEEGNDVTEATKHYTVESVYDVAGDYEPARNVSLIKNNKVSVIEPRIVAVPGTIKKNEAWTGINEDKQDPNCFYVAYGTSTNLKDVEKAPEDLFLSFSQDRGTTFYEDTWVVNPDSSGENAGETVKGWIRLAKGNPEQGEVQIRMTPNAERFYGCWLEEGEEGSDIFLRRLMPASFKNNNTVENQTDDDGDTFAEYQGDLDDSDPNVYPGSELVSGE
nr:choice-of-anchor O protein [uncultured Desulfobacter sp.]